MKNFLALSALVLAQMSFASEAPSCHVLASQIAQEKKLPATELNEILLSLNLNGHLPDKFVTKKMAQQAGWRPGSSLWQVLPGKSIGGDRFSNRERRLPAGSYLEADLDYQGGKRNAKRIVFSPHGSRYITVDHYTTFTEIAACK